ncbi:unnamed protein product, partial [Allacma fusca]
LSGRQIGGTSKCAHGDHFLGFCIIRRENFKKYSRRTL